MTQISNRAPIIDALLAELRAEIETAFQDDAADLEQIESAVDRIGRDFQRRLREKLASSRSRSGPGWLVETTQELRALLALPENWNSYGARSIREETVLSAIRLIERIVRADTPRPVVTPTTRGGVQLEWHSRGVDVEIEIDAPEQYQILISVPEAEGEEEFVTTDADLRRLSEALTRISRHE